MTNWKLLAKYIFDQPDKKEKEKTEKWIQKNPDNELLFKDLTRLKKMKNLNNQINTDKAWNNLKSRITQESEASDKEKETIRLIPKHILKYAAIVLILFGIGSAVMFSYEKIFNSNELVSEQNYNSGENKKVIFPDGSSAYLNNRTLVNYPNNFRKTNRLINIKGEAFFDVKSNPSKPFIIKAEKARIEVLGTSFNVRTNENDNIEVFVKSGKVKLSQVNNERNFLIIEPGYIGVIAQDEIKKMINDNKNYLSWVTRKLYFKDTHLQDVTQTLEKTYNVKITIEESINSDSLSLTSTFDDESIHYILEVISRTFDIKVKQVNKKQYLLTN